MAGTSVGHGRDRRRCRFPVLSPGQADVSRAVADLAPGRGDIRGHRHFELPAYGRTQPMALDPGFRRRVGRGDRFGWLVHGPVQRPADHFRMALFVGTVRGHDRCAAVPDGAGRGALVTPLRAPARARLGRRRHRCRQPAVRWNRLPSRLADRRPVRANRDRRSPKAADEGLVFLEPVRIRLRGIGWPPSRARPASADASTPPEDRARGAGAAASGCAGPVPCLDSLHGAGKVLEQWRSGNSSAAGRGRRRYPSFQHGVCGGQAKPIAKPRLALVVAGPDCSRASACSDRGHVDRRADQPIWLDARAHLGRDRGGRCDRLWPDRMVRDLARAPGLRRATSPASDEACGGSLRPCPVSRFADRRFWSDFRSLATRSTRQRTG